MVKSITTKTKRERILKAAMEGFFENSSNNKYISNINTTLLHDKDFLYELCDAAYFDDPISKIEFIYDFFSCLPSDMQDDKDFVLNMLEKNDNIYELLTYDLKDDFDITMKAIKFNAGNLVYASDDMKNNKKIILTAFKEFDHALYHASDNLKDDFEFVSYVIHHYKPDNIMYASDRLKNDFDMAWDIISIDCSCLLHMSDEIKDNLEIMYEAIKKDCYTYNFASDRLKNDPYIKKLVNI